MGAVEVVVTVVVVVLALVAYFIQHRRHQHGLFSRLGIPHVKPHLLYGSIHLLRSNLRTELLNNWMKKYGKVFGYYLGWKPQLIVGDLDLIKNILIRDFHNFRNRPMMGIHVEPLRSTMAVLRDQRWKDVRSVLTPTFSMVKMKHMVGIMNEKISLFLQILEERNSAGEAVDMYATFQGLTLDVISECVLAMKTNCQREQNDNELFKEVRQFVMNIVSPAALLGLYVPALARPIRFIGSWLAASGRMTTMTVEHVKKVITVRRRAAESRSVDVLQLMLDAAESRHIETSDDQGAKGLNIRRLLTDEEIIANAWVFLVAGLESSANVLTFTTYLLATHPEVQERLYKEVCSTVQDEGHLTYEDVHQMKYLDQVLSESLRLYPPSVNSVTRESSEDVQLGDITIPKGLTVLIPIWQIHHDPELWPDPFAFDPERFSSDNKASATRHPMAYIPFGAGPRICPGMRFAQLEAKLTLARLVKKFRLEICEGTMQPLTYVVRTIVLAPSKEVLLRAVPRDTPVE